MSAVAEAIGATCLSACFIFLVFSVTSCQKAWDAEREKTKQEAIKAGLVEGEYGRWVRPSPVPAEKP